MARGVFDWRRLLLVLICQAAGIAAALMFLPGGPLSRGMAVMALAFAGCLLAGCGAHHRRARPRLELAQQAGGVGVIDWDILSNRAECSKKYLELHGLTPAPGWISLEQWLGAIHSLDRTRTAREIDSFLQHPAERAVSLEYRVPAGAAGVQWLSFKGQIVHDDTGRAVRLIGAAADITERRRAEDAVRRARDELEEDMALRTVALERANRALRMEVAERRRAEEGLRRHEAELVDFFENAAVGIDWVSPLGVIERANRAELEMLGYPADEYIGHHLSEFCVDSRVSSDIMLRLAAGETLENYELRLRGRDGSVKYVVYTANGLWEDGRFVRARCFTRDITEARRAAHRLEASLREKEILLREIHHRVKNNLQIVSSLLSLQAEEVHDPNALEKFHESQSRIRSISLIHERLYQSGDLGQVDFAAYLENLARILIDSQRTAGTRPALHVQAEPAALSIEQAIPCALIVHELILNSLKHAFPGDQAGEIHVTFARDVRGAVTLGVSDNGVGFGERQAGRPASFGLSLVETLVGQLKGSLSVSNGSGAGFMVRFQDGNSVPRELQSCS